MALRFRNSSQMIGVESRVVVYNKLKKHCLSTLGAGKVGQVLGQLLHVGESNSIIVACSTPRVSLLVIRCEEGVSVVPDATNTSMA